MNIFTTEHPLCMEPSPRSVLFQKRFFWGALIGVSTYALYLFLLGPYHALDSNGYLDFIPKPMRELSYFPSAPVYAIPGLRRSYYDYLNWWYRDPNEADPETGW